MTPTEGRDTRGILETLESLRTALHPEISAPLLGAIVEVEKRHVENRGPAAGKLEALIEAEVRGDGDD